MRLNPRELPVLLLLGMAAGTWPVWRWYLLRLTDGSDEPWGLLALVTLVALRLRNGWGPPLREEHFRLPAVLLVLYLASFHAVVPLVRAVLAVAAFGLLLLRGQGAGGLWGLLGLHLLSLPIMATLQFYLGYPLRLLAAGSATAILRLCGLEVRREGTLLHWAGEVVMMDVPCSGVRMLWAGMYGAMVLAAVSRFDAQRTALLAGASIAIVVAGNVARATAVFFKEAHIWSVPSWTHEGAGLLVFAAGAWLILTLSDRLRPQPCKS